MSRRLVSEHGLHHRVGHPRSALQSFGPGARGRAFRRTHRHGIRFSRFAVPRVGLLWPRDVPSEVELATLAKYPFLRESSAFIRAEKVSLEEILLEPAFARARSLGKARVLEALERGAASDRVAIAPADQLAQLLAYPVARIFVSALEDTYLIRRFALREAIAAEGRLESESDDFVIHMASQLAMDLRREDGGFRLHFTDFLRFTNTMRDAPWKLINQRVDRGYVTLQRAKALRVMRNAIQRHIEEGLPLPVNDDIVSAFRADLREIRGILEAKKATFKAEDIGKVSITRFPPCMYNLLAQIQNHEERPAHGPLRDRRVPPSHRPGQRGDLQGLRGRSGLRGGRDEVSDRAHHGHVEPDGVHTTGMLDDEVVRHLPGPGPHLHDDQASAVLLPGEGA